MNHSLRRLKDLLHMGKPVFKFRLIGGQKDFLDNVLRVGVYPSTFIVGGDGGIIRSAVDRLMQSGQ